MRLMIILYSCNENNSATLYIFLKVVNIYCLYTMFQIFCLAAATFIDSAFMLTDLWLIYAAWRNPPIWIS